MWSRGVESRNASARPVNAYVNPGPGIVTSTPGRPEARAYPFAMKAAASSCVATTVRIFDVRKASKSATFCEPGRPKTVSTERLFEGAAEPFGALHRGPLPGSLRAARRARLPR